MARMPMQDVTATGAANTSSLVGIPMSYTSNTPSNTYEHSHFATS